MTHKLIRRLHHRHGRDSRICVWQLSASDEADLSKQPPVEDPTDATRRKQPWLLHVLDVPTLNFCPFANCITRTARGRDRKSSGVEAGSVEGGDVDGGRGPNDGELPAHDPSENGVSPRRDDSEAKVDASSSATEPAPLLLAVSGADQGTINIHALPSEKQVASIPAPSPEAGATGMVMSLRIFYNTFSSRSQATTADTETDIHSNARATGDEGDPGVLTVVAGYESGRIFVFRQCFTGNEGVGNSVWDGVEDGKGKGKGKGQGAWQITYTARRHEHPLLSLSLSPTQPIFFSSGADAVVARYPITSVSPSLFPSPTETSTSQEWGQRPGEKEVKTGHSGQQGLTVRSDGKIFATAGWEGKARVYSTKTLKEVAVLKWHKEGCYAIAFGDVGVNDEDVGLKHRDEWGDDGIDVVRRGVRDMTVREAREAKVQKTHWLAVGSKDAKISLWDIF